MSEAGYRDHQFRGDAGIYPAVRLSQRQTVSGYPVAPRPSMPPGRTTGSIEVNLSR